MDSIIMCNTKDIVNIYGYEYLNSQIQRRVTGHGQPDIDLGGHTAVVLGTIVVQGDKKYVCAKFQSYEGSNIKDIMDMNIERGLANKFTTRDGFLNDSYYFSQEIYLVDNSQIRQPYSSPTISDSGFFRLCSIIERNNIEFMSYDFSKGLVYNNLIEVLESNNQLDFVLHDINDFNKIYSFNVLESTHNVSTLDEALKVTIPNHDYVINRASLNSIINRGKEIVNTSQMIIIEEQASCSNINTISYIQGINERYNIYEAYKDKFVRDSSNSNVGQFLRDNDILPEQVQKFSIGYFTNLSTSESIELFKSQITNESLLSELNISDIHFDERVLGDRLTIPITNKYDRITGFVAIDYTGDKDIPIIPAYLHEF